MKAKITMEVLGKKGCQRIYEDGLEILDKTGVRVDDGELRAILAKQGSKAEPSDTVRFPKEMVKEALAATNCRPIIKCINGKELHIYGDNKYCGALTNDPWIVDYEQGPRKPCLTDIERHARLAEALPLIDMITRMDHSCTDVPDSIVDLKTIEALVSNTTKALFCAPATMESARIWVEVAEILAGGSLHKNPILGAYVATVSPLIMPAEYGQMLRYMVEKGVVMRGGGCPLSGATSPFTLAGTLALAEAEMLFAITAVQALSPGAPCLYCVGGYIMDMATGVFSTSSIPGKIMAIAYNEMAEFHDMPTLAGISSSDVPHYDFQNGVETALGSFLNFFGNRRNILYGLGSFANASGMSAEQIVLHHDLVEAFRRISAGIDLGCQQEAVASIVKRGPGGNFLTDDLTIKLLHSNEHFYGRSFVRANPGPVKETMLKRAHNRVEELLAGYQPSVDAAKVKEVRAYVEEKIKKGEKKNR